MAVTIVLGMTRSGKSKLAENKLIKVYKKVIVYDVMNCFKSIFHRLSIDSKFDLENTALDRLFDITLQNPKYFQVALVPGKTTDERKAFDKIITSSLILGEKLGSENEPLLLVTDEAGGIVPNHFLSSRAAKLVTKGRHYFVDSLFIGQLPHMIHTTIRGQASKVICFRIPTAIGNEYLLNTFGKSVCQKIQVLPDYHYVTWENTGNIYFTNENGKKYQ